MAKFKIYTRSNKYYKGDEVEYRTRDSIKHGTIIEAPKEYTCDTQRFSIGDFYIISDEDAVKDGNQITCYVINTRDINGRIE